MHGHTYIKYFRMFCVSTACCSHLGHDTVLIGIQVLFREASLGYSRKSYLDSTEDRSNKLRLHTKHTHGVMSRKPGILNRAQSLSHSCRRNFYSSNI